MGSLDAASPRSPQLGLHQPLPQRFPVYPDPVVLRQLFRRQRRSVVMPQFGPLFLPEQFPHSSLYRLQRLKRRKSAMATESCSLRMQPLAD